MSDQLKLSQSWEEETDDEEVVDTKFPAGKIRFSTAGCHVALRGAETGR